MPMGFLQFCRALAISMLMFAAAPSRAGVVEVGSDDFRITNFGPADDTFAFAVRQQMAYNPVDNEFFAVFLGRQPGPVVSAEEIELYGLRLSASGQALGDPVLLTEVDGVGSPGGVPQNRRVAYDPTRGGYMIVYDAQDAEFGATSNDIYGRFISATGQPASPTFVIDEQATGDFRPDIAVNTQDGELMVVWGSDNAGERTIRARRLRSSDGTPIGDTFRLDRIDRFKGNPSIAYNSDQNQYLAAWANNLSPPTLQVLAADGTPQLTQEQDYATAGFFTSRSQIVYNPDFDEYLIVFSHSDPAEGIVAESYEMFGRRIDAAGNPLGVGKFRISYSDFVDRFTQAGANINCGFQGQCLEVARPGVTYSAADQAYVVAWSGTVDVRRDGDREVFVRQFRAGADPAPQPEQTQISDMGSDDTAYLGLLPMIGSTPDGLLAVWWGDDNANGGIDDKFELWGQRLLLNVFADGFEAAD